MKAMVGMAKSHMLILGSVAVAVLLAIFGQDIAYFLDDHVAKIYPLYYLTGIPLISVFLYLVAFVLAFISFKKNKVNNDIFVVYLFIIFAIGLPASFWSIFVLAMWWG